MAEQSLAVRYRPKTFNEMTEQEYITIILENQIKTDSIKNAYLFTGPAGCGKTTSARIFASMINEGKGSPIEIDAASNNGVEQVRGIIEEAKFKSIDSKYKVYIMDECHMLSTGAWNAMLKLLEEPPKTTVFILCTTDPQKIPKTILSRVQRYDFQKISLEGIFNRLWYIINQENNNLSTTDEYIGVDATALQYIAKVAEGGMRDAISMLDKCLSFSRTLDVATVVKALGISDYTNLNSLLTYLLAHNTKEAINIVESVFNEGKDLKLFIKQLIQYILDTCKFMLFKTYDCIQIPNTIDLSYLEQHDYNSVLELLDTFIALSNEIKYEQNPRVLIESRILVLIGGNR